jgi:hypothetical protein
MILVIDLVAPGVVQLGLTVLFIQFFDHSFDLVSCDLAPPVHKAHSVVCNDIRRPFNIPDNQVVFLHFVGFFLQVSF